MNEERNEMMSDCSVWINGKLSGNNEADRQRIIRALEALEDEFPGKMSPANVKMAFNNYASGESPDFDLRLVNLTVAEAEAARMKDYLVRALKREGLTV
jgi:hypothetical protein